MVIRLLASCALVLAAGAARAQEIGDPQAGGAFARRVCAECHAVGPDSMPSPNPNAPSFVRIASVPGMTATALLVALQTSHRTMPNLVLAPDEMRDVIAYILTLKRG